jgi:DNA-binding transcriptional LysR family regulator
MDRFEDMRIYAEIVRSGSFTAAATKLGLTKQLVSRRISDLEDRLGVRLLNRTTRKLSPTELGRTYFERCVRLIAEIEEAEQELTNHAPDLRGVLRVTAPMSFSTMYLSQAIASFVSRHPALELEISLNDRVVDIVGEGFDMAIRVGCLPDSSLISRKLANIDGCVCVAPSYVSRWGVPQHPSELRQHNCLIYGMSRTVEWPFQIDGEIRNIQVSGRYRSNNGELARDAAIAGLGIVALPTFIVADALKSGRLVRILEYFKPALGMGAYALYPHHRQLAGNVRALIEHLQAHFTQVPWAQPAATAFSAARPLVPPSRVAR